MLTISGKALGRKKPLFADWSIPLPVELDKGGAGVQLRDVVSSIVRSEVAAFKKRQSDRQFLRALTAKQIEEGVNKGKIEIGVSDVPLQTVDEDEAVAAALQAFEDGLYLVVVDDEEQRSLNSQIPIHGDSRITFIRLTLLAGG
jgi:hypothetical protein